MRVVWRELARDDIMRIVEHITAENPVAAQRVARELLLAGESLLIFPRRGRVGQFPNTRELVAVFPYVLVYRLEDEGLISILRVWHGAQDR